MCYIFMQLYAVFFDPEFLRQLPLKHCKTESCIAEHEGPMRGMGTSSARYFGVRRGETLFGEMQEPTWCTINRQITMQIFRSKQKQENNTNMFIHIVDGRNPAPVGSWFISLQFHYVQCFIVTQQLAAGAGFLPSTIHCITQKLVNKQADRQINELDTEDKQISN